MVAFAPESSAMMLAIILLLSIWGTEQALVRRIKALVELFELQCGDGQRIGGAGPWPAP
jgi:hypothetical protein